MGKSKDTHLLLFLICAFAVALIVLVISHELGHFFASKSFGYAPKLSYDHTDFGFPKSATNNGFVSNDVPLDHEIWILAAGPLLTITIGTIGIVLLFIFRKPSRRNFPLRSPEWVFVILASFWLREAINFTKWLITIQLSNKISLRSDEMKIAGLLGWPLWSIFILSGFISAAIFLMVIFKFIPSNQRLQLLLSILTAGLIVDLLWLQWLGPIILP